MNIFFKYLLFYSKLFFMTKIALSVYWNDEIVMLKREDIAQIRRVSAEEDAVWQHDDPKAHTAIILKTGARTSQNVGTAYVRELPDEVMESPLLIVQ